MISNDARIENRCGSRICHRGRGRKPCWGMPMCHAGVFFGKTWENERIWVPLKGVRCISGSGNRKSLKKIEIKKFDKFACFLDGTYSVDQTVDLSRVATETDRVQWRIEKIGFGGGGVCQKFSHALKN